MNGWRKTTLSAVSDFEGGSQPPKSEFITEPKAGYVRLLQIRDFKSDDRAVYIPAADNTRTCAENDILIGRYGASVGQILTGKAGSYNVALIKTIPDTSIISRRFFYHYLNSSLFQEPLSAIKSRSAQDGFSKKDIADFPIFLPPLSEQRRIVDILDEAFDGIAKAIANTEIEINNADALFDGELNSLFENQAHAKQAKLSEICDVRDGTHDSPQYVANGIPFVTQKNIRNDGLSLENIKYISELDHQNFYKRSNVSYGDILMSMIGVNRGMACLVDDRRTFSIKNVCLIKDGPNVDMSYLLLYLKTDRAKNYVEEHSRGGAQPFIGLGKLRAFPVPVVERTMQLALVQRLNEFRENTTKLKNLKIQKSVLWSNLKQSLLHKAFTGQLTGKEDIAA